MHFKCKSIRNNFLRNLEKCLYWILTAILRKDGMEWAFGMVKTSLRIFSFHIGVPGSRLNLAPEGRVL